MSNTMAFLYKWTQHSTGMWYIGSRTARNCHPNDGYICSSKVVKPLIKETPNDWNREILVIGEPMELKNWIKNLVKTVLAYSLQLYMVGGTVLIADLKRIQ